MLAVLAAGAAGSLAAQLAAPQPTEKLLVLPLSAAPADSAAAIATTDAARARIISLARYKVNVIPKTKLCEVLQQSGFGCDVLITPQQAEQLSKALGINSFTGGLLTHTGNLYIARVHVASGASGFASTFTINGAATPAALGEAIAQRLNSIVKAAEFARNCNEQRSHNALDRALMEARKAFVIEPNLAEAWACIATVWELKKQPDSMMHAYRGALVGDSANAGMWSRIANSQMARGDTDGSLGTYAQELLQNPTDKNLRLALANQQLQRRKYVEALAFVDDGLKLTPADQQLSETRRRIVQDGTTNATDPAVKKTMSEALLGMLRQEATTDTAKLADTNNLKLAIGTAQSVNDTAQYLWWSGAAVRHHPTSVSFMKQLAGAYLLAGQTDSALFYYKRVVAQNPNDLTTSLLIGKTMVDNTVWDTAAFRRRQEAKDTAGLRRMREPFAAKLDSARQYLTAGFASSDNSLRLFTVNVAYTGGSKLAQAGALDLAYQWLDPAYKEMATDTSASHQSLRSIVGYFFGLASTYTLPPLLQQFGTSKKCDMGPALSQRLQRAKEALTLGSKVAAQAVRQPLAAVAQFEGFMEKVKKQFHCTNF
jgi:tetratricopeptide (TPR) repeat protein